MSREIRVLAADSDGAVREIIKHITSMEGWFCDLAGSGIDAGHVTDGLERGDSELGCGCVLALFDELVNVMFCAKSTDAY